MPRPIILFTGQWTDLPLEELCQKASAWGYQGLDLCCWGDHFEVQRALAGAISPTARFAHGLQEIAEHPDDDAAIDALVASTKRYASYQRKWMRRIPGLVSLPANRPPGETADAILEVARARQRLPAGRAG